MVHDAQQVAYHEGGGIFSDGYCGFGIIPSTAIAYNVNTASGSAKYCSAKAYEIYLDVGWDAWVTYGWVTRWGGYTEVSY